MNNLFRVHLIGIAALLALASCKPDPYLSVDTSSISFDSQGGNQKVNVTANYAWTAIISSTDFVVSPASGMGDGPVTITARAASSPDPTSATLTIMSEGLSAKVDITQAAEPTLYVTSGGISIPAEGGSYSISTQYNVDYTVTVADDAKSWIKVVKTKGLTNGTIEFQFEPNPLYERRIGQVTVKAADSSIQPKAIYFYQDAVETILINGSKVDVKAEGGAYEVNIQYNTDYTVVVEDDAKDWIKFIQTKALQSGKLEFSVSANNTFEPRTGRVQVKSNSGKTDPVTITFNQAEGQGIIITAGAVDVPAAGGAYTYDIQFNTDYDVTVSDDAQGWIKVVRTKAMESGQIEISVDANDTCDARSGSVVVKARKGVSDPVVITFNQAEPKAVVFETTEIRVPYTSGNFHVAIQYNESYNVDVEDDSDDWLYFMSSTKSLESAQLNFWVTQNDGAERIGHATVYNPFGKINPVTLTIIQEENPSYEQRAKNLETSISVLKEMYDTMDGANWNFNGGRPWFTTDSPGSWQGVFTNNMNEITELNLSNFGLKGELPESMGKLTALKELFISHNEELTGSLPASMANLTSLYFLRIQHTSMTSLTDIFSERMDKLEWIDISWNSKMTGPIPEGIAKLPSTKAVVLSYNAFTGTPSESLAKLRPNLSMNRLSGPVPDVYFSNFDYYGNIIDQQEGYGFDVSNYDLPGGYPSATIPDILGGEDIDFQKIISENKYTVYLFWAPWCPFSKSLMPQLVKYYNKYHQDGLEIVATVGISDEVEPGFGNKEWTDRAGQIKEINDKGYEIWYNFFLGDFRTRQMAADPYGDRCWYYSSTPNAEVYDTDGNIVFCSRELSDPVRDRFNKSASTDLMPFLESLFGPLEDDDHYTSKDFSQDGKVMTLQKATKGKGIDVVFMGDGYTDRDMGKGGLYETVMSQAMEELFAIEPYKSFRDRFNVYAVKAVSKNGRTGRGYDTAFGVFYGKGTEVNGNTDKAFEYASKAVKSTGNILVCVMVNSQSHSGTNIMFGEKQSSIAWTSTYGNDREFFGNTLRHEAGGHGFGFLADEYVTFHDKTMPEETVNDFKRQQEMYGWYANVDFTDDPAKVKWADFLADERYKDEVGIYEGALYYQKGAYRPSQNSMMNENFEYYNAPSRLAIYKRIMELSGEEYSFAKFLEYDAVNRGAAAKAAARPPLMDAARKTPRKWEPTAPPIVMP